MQNPRNETRKLSLLAQAWVVTFFNCHRRIWGKFHQQHPRCFLSCAAGQINPGAAISRIPLSQPSGLSFCCFLTNFFITLHLPFPTVINMGAPGGYLHRDKGWNIRAAGKSKFQPREGLEFMVSFLHEISWQRIEGSGGQKKSPFLFGYFGDFWEKLIREMCKDAQVNTTNKILKLLILQSQPGADRDREKLVRAEKNEFFFFFFFFFPQLFSSIDPEFSCEPILIRGKQKFWQLYNLVLNHLPGKMWKQLGILWLWMDAFDAPYWNSGFLWALISQKPARKRNLTFSLWNIQVRKAGRWWGSHKNLL